MENSTSKRVATLAVGVFAGALTIELWRHCRRLRQNDKARKSSDKPPPPPPRVYPRLPLLGNALSYKADPAGFLERKAREHRGCFELDLAGLRITIVSGRKELEQVALAGEARLSAQAAVADFGFAQTLGRLSVGCGTDLHRSVLKGLHLAGQAGSSLQRAVACAVRAALPEREGRMEDLFTTVRRIVLQAVMVHLLGEGLLCRYEAEGRDFLADFMLFQDRVEDATAKGVTLPQWLSLPLAWGPVARERHLLQQRLATAIEALWAAGGDAEMGFWLRAVHKIPCRTALPAWRRYIQRWGDASTTGPIKAGEAAELTVGLLFAAHKNPAIGAAQTLSHLLSQPQALGRVAAEARAEAVDATTEDFASGGLLSRSILETLRLTAHTIGGIRKVVDPDGFDLSTSDGRTFRVPCGRYIGLNHTLPNHSEAAWPDPKAFAPERWLQERAFDDYEFTTFSHGLHACPGRGYALRLMELTLAELLRHIDVKLEGPMPPISYARATLAQRAGPVRITYRQRAGRR